MKPIRLLFFILLLANVLFFAWRQNAGPATGHEPQRLEQQLAPEKLTLILPEKPAAPPASPPAPAPVAPAPEASATPASTTLAQAAAAAAAPTEKPAPPAAAPTPAPALMCKAFSGLSLADAKTAQAEITTRSPNTKTSLQSVKEPASYWVFIPPQASKAAADKKVAELKQLGVEDSFIITDEGPNRYAISLGLFHNKDTADTFFQSLGKKGVRSAKLDVRDKASDKTRLEVNAPAEALGTLAREIKTLAAASISDCKAP